MPVLTESHGDVWVVTIDRPSRRNAVDLDTLVALRAAQESALDGGARVLVLTGRPPAFCAGADLTGVEGSRFGAALMAVLHGFVELPFPVMAAIDGPALGAGMQLALSCDLRVATAAGRFGIPAAKLGLAIDHWTVERLAREVGWSVARDMLLGASVYDTAALRSNGFVHRDGGLDEAMQWASEVARLAPLTLASHKLMLRRSALPPEADDVVEASRAAAWGSADFDEGRRAFLEKRPPQFRGR
jgi:enoyl-CoA hydratase